VKLVDSHCHLDHSRFSEDRDAVIARARAAGVERMLAIGTGDGPHDLEAGIRLAEKHTFMLATIGVHPHEASKATVETFDRLRELAKHPKVVAIGEIGLDYHYDFSPRDAQMEVFRLQLEVAAEARLPIVIHTREAWADTLALLRGHWKGEGIFHCFTGNPGEAREALDLGFYLSYGGVVTFPRSEENRAAAKLTPADRMLLETDAPYLAPVPHRGKRNEPALVAETARFLAGVLGMEPDALAEATTANFERFVRYTG
jgi:TatD DNase family protein